VKKNEEHPLATVVEFHPIDPVEDLDGKIVTLFFHKKMRGEKTFSGPDDMQHQLRIDKEQVEELIF